MKEIKLTAVKENIPRVTAFVDAELEAMDCPVPAQMQMDIAIDEVFVNISNYAYTPETGDALVTVDYDAEERAVKLEFRDWGKPFDPVSHKDPDVKAPLDERQIGGLGIFLVKKIMDEVSYRREDGQNVLTLRKKI